MAGSRRRNGRPHKDGFHRYLPGRRRAVVERNVPEDFLQRTSNKAQGGRRDKRVPKFDRGAPVISGAQSSDGAKQSNCFLAKIRNSDEPAAAQTLEGGGG